MPVTLTQQGVTIMLQSTFLCSVFLIQSFSSLSTEAEQPTNAVSGPNETEYLAALAFNSDGNRKNKSKKVRI